MARTASWKRISAEIEGRIRGGAWKPGERIPREADLAEEFACARATVHRALRTLVDQGLIVRRRRAGSRVVKTQVRRTEFRIPVIRHEVEAAGHAYGYRLVSRKSGPPPESVRDRMKLEAGAEVLHLEALHFAGERAHAFESRWINPGAVRGVLDVDFKEISANEYLVGNVPFSTGEISLSAAAATKREARLLGVPSGAALFVTCRATWSDGTAITVARLAYPPGFELRSRI